MFLPFLRALRHGYPSAHIAAVFSSNGGADEVLSTLAPGVVDEVIRLNTKGKGGLRRLWSGIRLGLRGWDMVVFRFNGFTRETISAAFVGRARYRVGHTSSPDWHNRWESILNIPVVMLHGAHEVERYQQMAETLQLPIVETLPSIEIPAEAAQALEAKLSFSVLERERPWVALAPGSSPAQAWKRWPEELWVQLTAALARRGIRAVFTGSRAESTMIDSIIERADAGAMALNTAGRLSLAESAALVDRAPAVVCCDSALIHLAAALGTPIIGIFGPTDDKRTGPLGEDHLVLRSPDCKGGCYSLRDPNGHLACDTDRCMRGVTVERVVAAIMERVATG